MTEETMHDVLAGVGETFLNLRLEAKLTQRQVAKALGVGQARVSDLENSNKIDVKLSTLKKFADFYGQELWIFITPPEEVTDGQEEGVLG